MIKKYEYIHFLKQSAGLNAEIEGIQIPALLIDRRPSSSWQHGSVVSCDLAFLFLLLLIPASVEWLVGEGTRNDSDDCFFSMEGRDAFGLDRCVGRTPINLGGGKMHECHISRDRKEARKLYLFGEGTRVCCCTEEYSPHPSEIKVKKNVWNGNQFSENVRQHYMLIVLLVCLEAKSF